MVAAVALVAALAGFAGARSAARRMGACERHRAGALLRRRPCRARRQQRPALWLWGIGCVAFAVGSRHAALRRAQRWPRALIAAALVQLATLETMILGKDHFGRLRPHEVLATGDWSHLWFAGGDSFPFGPLGVLFRPAAAARRGVSDSLAARIARRDPGLRRACAHRSRQAFPFRRVRFGADRVDLRAAAGHVAAALAAPAEAWRRRNSSHADASFHALRQAPVFPRE